MQTIYWGKTLSIWLRIIGFVVLALVLLFVGGINGRLVLSISASGADGGVSFNELTAIYVFSINCGVALWCAVGAADRAHAIYRGR